MKIIEIKSLEIEEIKVLKFSRFPDNRGYFTEPFRLSQFNKEFLNDFKIYQINESFSKKGVIRGLHFQWNPYMGKLVRTIHGFMIDLFLDIRKNSPSYGKISAYEMPSTFDRDFSEWIWIPPGFAHGNIFFEDTVIEYLCTGEYSSGCEAGINPLDKYLDWSLCPKKTNEKINQMIKKGLIISEKDKKGLNLKEWGSDERSNNFVYEIL